jgi:hypothetical protein
MLRADMRTDRTVTCRITELPRAFHRLSAHSFLPSAHSGHEHESLRREPDRIAGFSRILTQF